MTNWFVLSIPSVLADAPFRVANAVEAGLPADALRGSRFRRLFRGVYVVADRELDLGVWLRAALLILPGDALVSHVTALRVYGLDLGRPWPLHFSTNCGSHARHKSKAVRLHRRKGRLTAYECDGIPITGPDRTLVDIATKVGFIELIQAVEWMLHRGLTTIDGLAAYAFARHLDGVRRMRRALALVRDGVESPMETVLRLMIVFARLPEPECNLDIRSADGRFIARGDLVLARWKVLVEYDGWHRERDGRQRQRDRERREELEAAGWRVIVVTSEDMKHPREVVRRVHAALVLRGYAGPPPLFNLMWTCWFES